MIRVLVFLLVTLIGGPVFGGEVTVQAPVVDGVEAESFGIWVSRRTADREPPEPWKVPEPVFGPIEIKADEDWIIIVKISTGRPTGMEGAIYHLRELVGAEKGDEK